MREYVPVDAEEGFAFLVKNADSNGVEINLIQQEGQWYAFSKQRDYSDLGDPFQSVGEPYQPKKVKLNEQGTDVVTETEDNQEIEKILPVLAAVPAALGAAAKTAGAVAGTVGRVGAQAASTAARMGAQAAGPAMRTAGQVGARTLAGDGSSSSEGSEFPEHLDAADIYEIDAQYNPEIGVTEVESPQDRGIISIDDGVEREVRDMDVSKPANKNDRRPNLVGGTKVPRRIKEQADNFKQLEYSDIDEGRVPSKPIQKQSNEGGLGVDDPEALNDGTAASSQHYRKLKEEEENKKSSLAMKAYANPEKDAQKPIDPDEDGREALSSAETGTGTQAFSSGAVIDISPDETNGENINTKASGGAGGEGVEGGGDGSVTMIAPMDPAETLPTRRGSEPEPDDFDSGLNPKNRDLRQRHVVPKDTSYRTSADDLRSDYDSELKPLTKEG